MTKYLVKITNKATAENMLHGDEIVIYRGRMSKMIGAFTTDSGNICNTDQFVEDAIRHGYTTENSAKLNYEFNNLRSDKYWTKTVEIVPFEISIKELEKNA